MKSLSVFVSGIGVGVAGCVLLGLSAPPQFPMLALVKDTITTSYIEKSLNDEVLELGAIRGYLSALNDPHTRWVDPVAYKKMKDLVSGASISPGQLRSIDRVRLFGKIGYIRVTSFESLVIDQEVSSVIKTLKRQGMTGLMIDLRGNGGGLLSSAINVSNLFLSGSVPIVHTVDRSGKYETDYSKKTAEFSTLPLIILVDETSASSSEILAGAIQDNGRGTIVGSHRTYGKATMQKVFVLPNGSAILYTAAKYLTPSGRDITKIGILPDVVAPPATGRREMSGGAMDSMIQEAIRRFGEAEK